MSIHATNFAGQKHGRLTALEFRGMRGPRPMWLFRCECGNQLVASIYCVRSGNTKSCGCLKRDVLLERNMRHGLRDSPTYVSWAGMITRCTNPRAKQFGTHGARGIRVCEHWREFENFLADMGERPSMKHSIDRIDNDGHYEPGNCRWATIEVQNNNTRHNKRLTFDGRTLNVKQWSRETGINYTTLHDRLNRGWSVERALTEPIDQTRRNHVTDFPRFPAT